MSRSKLRLLLWRWHRRLGLAAALFILLVAVSGILLNHSVALGWDQQPLRSRLLLAAYGVEPPRITSFAVNGDRITHLGGDYLYRNGEELAYCRGNLTGAVSLARLWVVACGDELLLFTPDGQVIERIGEVYGLPQPVDALGRCGEKLCLQSDEALYQADIDQLRWTPAHPPFVASEPHPLSARQRADLIDAHLGEGITWERAVLDLHSGRLFGLGPWLMDFVGGLLVLLALSGFYIWFSGRHRSSASHRLTKRF